MSRGPGFYFGIFILGVTLGLLLWTLYTMVRIALSSLRPKKKLLWLLFLLLTGPVGAVLWLAIGAPAASSPSTSAP
jgi:multisubunit Na+/H+ antiporter MnhG subunit